MASSSSPAAVADTAGQSRAARRLERRLAQLRKGFDVDAIAHLTSA